MKDTTLRLTISLLALLTLAAWVGSTPPADARQGSAVMHAAGVEASPLMMIRVPVIAGSCNDDCVGCTDPDEHRCAEDAGSHEDNCQHEENCTSQGSCADHLCKNEEQQQEQEDLMAAVSNTIELIPQASVKEIQTFLAANPAAAFFNTSRGVIQFRGCGTRIVAQSPLSPAVAEALTAEAAPQE